jgi:ABC-type transporter Mla MlaB component
MRLENKDPLLRITVNQKSGVHMLVLQGRLAGRSVEELTAIWNASRSERAGCRCVIDLVDVTSVDEGGEQALLAMMNEGAEFIAQGFYIKSLLKSLRERGSEPARHVRASEQWDVRER